MARKPNWREIFKKGLPYILVAALASACSFLIAEYNPSSKLDVLQNIIENRYIGETDEVALGDAAADAMVKAIGDRWSYYIPASEMESYEQDKTNSYVGVGITISRREDDTGYDIKAVEPGGPAQKAGILPGDVVIEAGGQSAAGMELAELKALIQGKEGTKVTVAILRDGQRMEFELTRKKIKVPVVEGQMLDDKIGYVRINNFNDNCASEGKNAIDTLLEEGAQALIFDVRNNGGGYLAELAKLLDHLLPEGVIYQSVDYLGIETVKKSDKDCVQVPMAVLINGSTYSAAEFFAAALEEYEMAITVGQQTVGKGYFQYTIDLPDGSAVNLSTGKYLTPNGVNLQEQGGLTPNIAVELDEQTAALLRSDLLKPEDDPQIQAAIAALQ